MFLQGGKGVKEFHTHSPREKRLFRCGCFVNHEQSEMNWHDDLQTYCSKRITIKNKIIKNKESRKQMRIACQIQIEKIPKTKMR